RRCCTRSHESDSRRELDRCKWPDVASRRPANRIPVPPVCSGNRPFAAPRSSVPCSQSRDPLSEEEDEGPALSHRSYDLRRLPRYLAEGESCFRSGEPDRSCQARFHRRTTGARRTTRLSARKERVLLARHRMCQRLWSGATELQGAHARLEGPTSRV